MKRRVGTLSLSCGCLKLFRILASDLWISPGTSDSVVSLAGTVLATATEPLCGFKGWLTISGSSTLRASLRFDLADVLVTLARGSCGCLALAFCRVVLFRLAFDIFAVAVFATKGLGFFDGVGSC